MEESLLEKIAPSLKRLESGGYARTYKNGARRYRSNLHQAVAEILASIGLKVEENVPLPGGSLRADFRVNGTYIFVDSDIPRASIKNLKVPRKKLLSIRTSSKRSDDADLGIRAVQLGSEMGELRQTIFLDDPSFNFDYAHILPQTQKCSVMHGHTSSALVEIIGEPKDGMVVDFGVAKEVIRGAIRSLDHKLFINRKYVTAEDPKSVTLRFRTVHGDFIIQAPRSTTVLLHGEATVENLADEVLTRIIPGMPSNVTAVGVYVYEGLNKGSHLLAQVHSKGAGKTRSGQ